MQGHRPQRLAAISSSRAVQLERVSIGGMQPQQRVRIIAIGLLNETAGIDLQIAQRVANRVTIYAVIVSELQQHEMVSLSEGSAIWSTSTAYHSLWTGRLQERWITTGWF